MDRLITDARDLKMLHKWLDNQKLPYEVRVTKGRPRSTEQNRLQHLWMAEISQQRDGMTPEDIRLECKLLFGVPIRCRDNETYAKDWHRISGNLSYENQVLTMRYYAVTRDMNTKQLSDYLDAINRHCADNGVILTQPDDQGLAA